MAYDDALAERVRAAVVESAADAVVEERKMFGGLSFLIDGNLAVSVSGLGGLLVRTGVDDATELIQQGPAELAVMGERTMRQWVRVSAEHVAADDQLHDWVDRGVTFARSLPRKR